MDLKQECIDFGEAVIEIWEFAWEHVKFVAIVFILTVTCPIWAPVVMVKRRIAWYRECKNERD